MLAIVFSLISMLSGVASGQSSDFVIRASEARDGYTPMRRFFIQIRNVSPYQLRCTVTPTWPDSGRACGLGWEGGGGSNIYIPVGSVAGMPTWGSILSVCAPVGAVGSAYTVSCYRVQ